MLVANAAMNLDAVSKQMSVRQMKPNIQDIAEAVVIMEARTDRLRLPVRWNFVRMGRLATRRHSRRPWQDAWLGKPFALLFGASDTASGHAPSESPTIFARAFTCRTLRQEPSVRSIFLCPVRPRRWIFGTTNLDLRLFMIRIFQIRGGTRP